MASNDVSNSKSDSKLIQCKNCKQDILASKMFLHEGFCNRNNVFCDHCKKVFLKKDYENHLKDLSNKNNRNSSNKKNKNKTQKETQKINVYRSPIITKRKTTFEYIEMPMTEEYKINNPIIISGGKIVSNQNKNEFLLPYFGFKNIRNNHKMITKEYFDNLNQTELFKDANSLIKKYGDFTKGIDLGKQLKNSSSTGNIKNTHNLLNGNLIFSPYNEQINYDNQNIIKEEENNNNKLLYNKSSLTNIASEKIINENEEKLNDIDYQINNNNDINEENKQNKKNNIIINNNIITYNSSNNINKNHELINSDENQIKNQYLRYNNKDKPKRNFLINIPKEENNTKFYSTRKKKNTENFEYYNNNNYNLLSNNSNKKEPNDSKPKKTFANYRFTSYILEKKPQNNYSKRYKVKPMPQSEEKKNKKKSKCEFCNNIVDDLVMHYQYYHLTKLNENLVPRKRDTALLNEKLNEENTDEVGIDENKKKILLREFKPNLKVNTLKNDNKNCLTTQYVIKEGKFKKPENISKVTNIKVLGNYLNNKNKKYNSLINSQGRNCERRNFLQSNSEDYIRSENRASSDRVEFNIPNSPEIKTGMINFDNNNLYINNPYFYFTEERKNENYYKSPSSNYDNYFYE